MQKNFGGLNFVLTFAPKFRQMEKIVFKNVEICTVNTSKRLIKKISQRRGLSESRLSYMLNYNILSVKQLSDITGQTVNAIEKKTRAKIKYVDNKPVVQEPLLTAVYPFFSVSSLGFKFILRDDNCENFIKSFYF